MQFFGSLFWLATFVSFLVPHARGQLHGINSWHSYASPGSRLNFSLQGAGSHRSVVYTPDIGGLNEELGCEVAQVIIVHGLPAEVHLDPYELDSLNKGIFGTSYFAHGQVNLEMPGPLCQLNTLTVHFAAPDGAALAGLPTAVAPVHARYPALTGCHEAGTTASETSWHLLSSGTVDVDIGLPTLLASCSAGMDHKQGIVEEALRRQDQEPVKSSSQYVLGHGNEGESSGVLWRIPSGNTCHTKFVGLLSSTVASLLCIYLLVEVAFVRLKD